MRASRGKEESMDEKRKSVASIPANYVSILQLQERWLKEKERKHKGKLCVERGVNGVTRREEEEEEEEVVMKAVKAMELKVKVEEKGLGGGFRMHCGMSSCKKEPKCVPREELEASAIVSNKDEDGGDSREIKKINPVKEDVRRVFTSKKENAARDSIAKKTQFQHVWINKRVEEEGREVKGPARLHNGQTQRHAWTTRTMVWVEKGKNAGAAGENVV